MFQFDSHSTEEDFNRSNIIDENSTSIQRKYSFYRTRSKHGETSAEGALRNKRIPETIPDDELRFKMNSIETKARLKKFEQQKKVFQEAQMYYDTVRIFPKSN